ncbi:MAG: DUF2703 domain-containing protein [Pseudomonadota bacterium]
MNSISPDTNQLEPTVLKLDFLFLDETVCKPCGSTGRALDEAVAIVAEPLAAMGKALEVQRVHVANRQDAIAHELVASPTIRLNGIDIDPAVTQGECGSCGDIAGGKTTVNCRTWQWRGETQSAAPTGMIVQAILAKAIKTAQASPCCVETEAEKEARGRYTLPQNLDRFFQARDAGEKRCC